MRLNRPLLRLPIDFCGDTLAAEVRALPDEAWIPHPNNLPGNEAVTLATPGGRITNDFAGAHAPTEHLLACPYMMEVMAEIGAVWGRTRLMRLAPGAVVPSHVDLAYYWRSHIRLHVPAITNPDVRFTCGGETIHMAAGECWTFNSFKRHHVANEGSETRVHLVMDTVGGERLWDLIDQAQDPEPGAADRIETLLPGEGDLETLAFEQVNHSEIMSPWEIRCNIAYLEEEAEPNPLLGWVFKRLDRLATGWAAAWAQYGPSDEGLPTYQRLLAEAKADLGKIEGGEELPLRNGFSLYVQIDQLIFLIAAPRSPIASVQRPRAAVSGLASADRRAS